MHLLVSVFYRMLKVDVRVDRDPPFQIAAGLAAVSTPAHVALTPRVSVVAKFRAAH